MYSRDVIVKVHNGLHTRIAAMVVNKASEIKGKYNVDLYISRKNSKSPMAISMLALVSLKIQQDEIVTISTKNEDEVSKEAVGELCNFISHDLVGNNTFMNVIDAIIEESTIANEQILDNLPIGIIVIDVNCYIASINNYALRLLGKTSREVIGKYVIDIIPNSDLPHIIRSKEKQFGKIQHINNHITMVNRSPIFLGEKVIGAIGVFQDVSELVGMKELNEKFTKILESSHDSICFVDEHGKISYVNPSYEQHFKVDSKEVMGKDIYDIAPKGLRVKVFKTKKKIENHVHHKEGREIISTVEPIFIDGEFKGVISSSKTVEDIKDLLNKLEKSEEELNYYREELIKHTRLNSSFKDIIGSSSTLREVLLICEKASQSTSTVLIRGESGTGKELIAKAIHNNSDRKDKPFVRVNCAAIPENLLESELFGYEKGAFTGAIKSKPGKFAIANGGTIFLDEIGDMPISMQVKLLRVLQEREIESLGGIDTLKIDVRVIAATNRNLEEMLTEKTFREDLYYRLNVISLNLPPLRDRKEDISLLIEHFINKINLRLNKDIIGIDGESLVLLQGYHWPGNIRELENIIERAMNLCDGKLITPKDLPSYISNSITVNKNLINTLNDELLPFEEYEKEIITLAMKRYKSFNKAGKALGLTHRTISLKCKKYGIEIN